MLSATLNGHEYSLVTRLSRDDEDAFCELYIMYKDRLVYFAQKFLKSREAAEDVCHDTFAVLWESRRFLDPDSSFSSYLYTITRNRVLNVLRSEQSDEKLREHIMSRAVDAHETTSETVSTNELQEIIGKALDSLSARQREVFEMSREKNMTHKEIAEILGLSVYTVQEHVSSALKTIREVLRKHYGSGQVILLLLAYLNS